MAHAKVVVLGGSTPFLTAMFDELSLALEGSNADPTEIVLYGRDAHAVELVAGYGHRRLEALGWTVHGVLNMVEALAGADVVIHQIRYGSLEGRAQDERLAETLGVPADETLPRRIAVRHSTGTSPH